MADSFIRRLRILEMLTRKEDGVITIPEIITRLSSMGIDIGRNKTVERDMLYLSTQLNIGCDDMTRPFQWWWADKDAIDIPGMGRNSALSFKLSQQYLEPLLPKQSLGHLQPKFKQAQRVLSGKGKEKERRWINKIRVVPKMLKQLPAMVPTQVQNAVYEALYEEKMLLVDYLKRSNAELSRRRINPLALIYRGITTELIFSDEGSTQVKRFILNRLKKAQVQIQSVSIPQDFDLDDYMDKNLGFPGTCKIIQFKAWVHPTARANVEETPLSKDQRIEEAEYGGIVIRASIRDTAELRTWILGLGVRIIVLEPAVLRETISGAIQGMADNYQ